MISAGVPAGATMPYHSRASPKSLKPASVMVGTSGRLSSRFKPDTDSARSLPPRMCGLTEVGTVNMMPTWPPKRSITAGPAPLYGTCTILVLVIRRNSSPINCGPAEVEAKVSLPGCAFASCASSFIFLAGTDGCTTNTYGISVPRVTGAKSRKVS